MTPARPQPRYRKANAPQLVLPARELDRLANTIDQQYRAALSDHEARMQRFTRYYQYWRGRTDMPVLGEEAASNFSVPIIQWQTYTKLSKEMGALFGDDAEIVAVPVGEEDERNVRKISRYMTWRVFNSMRIINRATTFNFRKVLFGRSHAYAPWVRDTYMVPLENGSEREEVHYEGPGFFPLWPDDLVVPAEDVESIQEFSWTIRRYRATPDELLRGEGTLYQGIRDHFQDILAFATQRKQRDWEKDRIKREKDYAEGVTYELNLSAGNVIPVIEWYGRWRPLKGKADGRLDNFERRDTLERDWVVRYLPDMKLVIGVQDLAEMYPLQRWRRPFVEASLVKDGSYWCPSFGELLESVQLELTANHNLGTEAGEISVGPIIFYRPGSGFDPDNFEYQPRMCVATEDPGGVKVVETRANLEYTVTKEQTLIGYGERVTGQTDMNMGRAVDRPNAPRTARQTLALLQEGDVRASLDVMALREDWGEILRHFWLLDSMYSPESVFFRVTEQHADGLFETRKGGAVMTSEERGGKYDFDLKFATSVWSKETEKQNRLALYQIDLQNPIVVQNPRALWVLLDKIHRAFGDSHFADIIPEPPDPGLPVKPQVELTRMLQGELVSTNPMDDDRLHLIEHNKDLKDMREDPDRDEEAYRMLVKHTLDHIEQFKQKQLMAAMMTKLGQHLAQNTATGQGLQNFGAGRPIGMEDLHAAMTQLLAGGGQPGAPGSPGEPGGMPQPGGAM